MNPDANTKQPEDSGDQREPRGLGAHAHGLAAEYAQEQGWGTSVEERTTAPPAANGGNDYDYGAQDFGDVPTDQQAVQPSPAARQFLTGDQPQQEEK